MRKFSVRPTLTMKGRTFKGPRGLSGKPSHPPLTDVPIAAYLVAAVFDVISTIAGDGRAWADELWHAGTYLFIAGVIVSVFAALTGLADARDSSEAGTQARRTINTHAAIMVTVTVLALINLAWRLSQFNVALGRDRTAGVAGRHLRRIAGVRVRIQRRDSGRPSGMAPVRNRRVSRRGAPGSRRVSTAGELTTAECWVILTSVKTCQSWP